MDLRDDQEARILVVDDDQDLANILVEMLVKLGYKASAAYGGREGLVRLADGLERHGIEHPRARLVRQVVEKRVPGLLWTAAPVEELE